ncbi:hypothetical protein X953_19950 (plasmid) [Virgibacillus sp. SK37]|nr:hypothetical protein X953_19950 [Virgibacillus sp. SK37]
MLWLILILFLVMGIFLIVKSKTKSYKILGYVVVTITLVFALVIFSGIGVKTDKDISEEQVIIK